MLPVLKTKSIFILLVPVFFLLHAWQEYFGYVEISKILVLLIVYCLAFGLLYFIVCYFFKAGWKAAIFILYLQLVFFFFSSFHLWLKKIVADGFLSRYVFLLPVTALLLILLTVVIKKMNKPFTRFFFYLNLVFLLFIVADIFILVQKVIAPGKIIERKNIGELKLDLSQQNKPNIYFLVFDEYASTLSLHQRFAFENNLDSLLRGRGFTIIPKSVSNYNFTQFSMTSMLNMDYLKGFDKDAIVPADYQEINKTIADNKVMHLLENEGYKTINLSIFDFDKIPSQLHKSPFLPQGTELITGRTFFNHALKDLGWALATANSPFRWLYKERVIRYKKDNQFIYEQVKNLKNYPAPFFLYGHFNMPHVPFYYDAAGNERPVDLLLKEFKEGNGNYKDYLAYLRYVNSKITTLADTIISREKGNAIIIIAGDHGYRAHAKGVDSFRNFNAIYFPSTNTKAEPLDSISMVNEFRYVFNTAFNQQLPFIGDSLIRLKDVK